MRWAAALLVFLYHVWHAGYFGGREHAWVNRAFAPGLVGVSFFFVLSGFVLAWSARPGDRAPAFWRRRIARVYPVHLVTAAVTLLLAFTVLPGLRPRDGHVEVVANLLLVSAWRTEWWQAVNPVSWSLVCEAFFYAAFPALFAVVRRLGPGGLHVVAALCAVAVMSLPGVESAWHLGLAFNFPPVRLPEFVLGMALARLVALGRWYGPGPRVSLAVTAAGYLLVPELRGAYASATVLGFALLIAAGAVADVRGTPSPWRGRRLVRLGEWSFAFYMVHLLVLSAAGLWFGRAPHAEGFASLGAAALLLAVSLALSAVLYHAVELPGQRLLLRRRRRAAGCAAR
ncbi:acyltransferase family protein [Streptomyces sp. NPDC093595]|uniref:acyltransferase family protein n=1 Tax=Streptomyces sp. NPDC093595 TaxID=3366045 RepID=UPI00381E7E89